MKTLDKIVQTLIINGTITEQPGLYYGKTGIAVFFFHFSRQTGNGLFHEIAIELIDEIQKQLTFNLSSRYDIGLPGIGVGFEYFLQNGFIETENSDFFDDFDERMNRIVMNEPFSDLSIEGGLSGCGRYFIYRLQGKGKKNNLLHKSLKHISNKISQKIEKNDVLENEQPDVFRFLHDMVSIPEYAEKNEKLLFMCREWKCIQNPNFQKIFPLMGNVQRLYAFQNYFNMDLTEEIDKEWEKWKVSENKALIDIGLMNGWASEGMLYLTTFNNLGISWLNLI